jgi:glutamate-ammonia-ligase adenylyltransferase
VRLPRPPDLPAALAERYERVVARVAELDAPLPPTLAADAARVVLVSDFVLGVLLRDPEALVERLADDEPLTGATVEGRLNLAALSEDEAMRQLRRMRQIEMARIAWRDIAGSASLDATFADVSLLANV